MIIGQIFYSYDRSNCGQILDRTTNFSEIKAGSEQLNFYEKEGCVTSVATSSEVGPRWDSNPDCPVERRLRLLIFGGLTLIGSLFLGCMVG